MAVDGKAKSIKSLKAKMTVMVIVLLTAIILAMSAYSYFNHRSDAIEAAEGKAMSIARLIGGIAGHTFLTQDYTLIDEAITKALENEDVLFVRVSDKNGNSLRDSSKETMPKRFLEVKSDVIMAETSWGVVNLGFSTEKIHAMLARDVAVTAVQSQES